MGGRKVDVCCAAKIDKTDTCYKQQAINNKQNSQSQLGFPRRVGVFLDGKFVTDFLASRCAKRVYFEMGTGRFYTI